MADEAWIVKCWTCLQEWDMNMDPEACTCYPGDEYHQLRITDSTGETLLLSQPDP